LAEVMYQSGQQGGEGQAQGGQPTSSESAVDDQQDDEVIDAEFVDVDEKK